MELKIFHHTTSTKYIISCLSEMIALHQNMAHRQNTLTVLTLRLNVHIRNKMLQHSFVTGFGSDLGQTFRPRQTKSGVCVGKRADYFATIFALKEGNALFNDALNTFYLRLYGVRHMVKDHSDSKSMPHGLLIPISSKDSFICTIPQTG